MAADTGEIDKRLEEKGIASRQVYDGRMLKVFCDRVKLPDGRESAREYIRHPGASAAVVLRDGAVLLERQWRYARGRAFWEVPAGKLDAGEDPLFCAKRELHEETGCSAGKWTGLGAISPCIGYSNEVIHLFLAEDIAEGERELDAGEFLTLAWVPFDEALAMASGGAIDDAKSIAALFRAAAVLRSRDPA